MENATLFASAYTFAEEKGYFNLPYAEFLKAPFKGHKGAVSRKLRMELWKESEAQKSLNAQREITRILATKGASSSSYTAKGYKAEQAILRRQEMEEI